MEKRLSREEAIARTFEVADMILDGKTHTQIADHYGYMSISAVNHLLERHLLFLDKEKYDAVKKKIAENSAKARSDSAKKNAGKNRVPNPEKLKRARTVADYMIETNCRYADAERHFGLSINSASPLIHGYLKEYDSTKYIELMNVIERRKCPVGSFVAPKISEDIELKFDKNSDIAHNSKVVYSFIMDKKCSYLEAADYFEISKKEARRYAEHGCTLKNEDIRILNKVALRGNYTGDDTLVETRYGFTLDEYKAADNKNSHMICDYILQNNALVSEASAFFGISNISYYIDLMAEIDYDKYYEIKKGQMTRSANTKILPNPKQPIISPTIMVSEPIKVAAEVEAPIVKDSEIPVVRKVSDVKVEMVSEPTVQNVSEPKAKPTFFQRVKKFFLGA